MEFQAYDIALVPVIIAVTKAISMAGVPNRFLPAVSLVLGLITGFVYVAPDDIPKAVLTGLVLGLSATGLYSGVKNTVKTSE